ncbi:MAG TPA: ATP synthase F1 subunit epsilon [Bryobacteraceae bacterium]
MADTFQLEIATPERRITGEPVHDALLPGEEGYFEVLPDHGALLSILDPGVVSYRNEAGTHIFVIDGGFVEVLDNCVRVLTNHVQPAAEIDAASARREMEETSKAVGRAQEQPEAERAMHAYKLARGRVAAAERFAAQG